MTVPPTPSRISQPASSRFLALALGLAWQWSASAQATCTEIRFPPGQDSTVIAGQAPAEEPDSGVEPLCYALDIDAARRIHIKLLSGRNVALSVPGQSDAKDTFEFEATPGLHELRVFQLFPTGEPAPFRVRVEIQPPAH